MREENIKTKFISHLLNLHKTAVYIYIYIYVYRFSRRFNNSDLVTTRERSDE